MQIVWRRRRGGIADIFSAAAAAAAAASASAEYANQVFDFYF